MEVDRRDRCLLSAETGGAAPCPRSPLVRTGPGVDSRLLPIQPLTPEGFCECPVHTVPGHTLLCLDTCRTSRTLLCKGGATGWAAVAPGLLGAPAQILSELFREEGGRAGVSLLLKTDTEAHSLGDPSKVAHGQPTSGLFPQPRQEDVKGKTVGHEL